MNIIKNRYVYFLISLLVILPGLGFVIFNWMNTGSPLRLGIDFTGGSLLEIQFEGTRPSVADIETLYDEFSTDAQPIADALVQPLGDDSFTIRSKRMENELKTQLVAEMETRFGSKVILLNFTTVSAAVGAEVTQAAGIAIAAAAIAILLYISYAFRRVEHAIRYGTAAILAMLHDVLVVIGVEAMFGYFLGWDADALFLTALLTVIGFSVHDTIVVFDRVRENSTVFRRLNFEALVNHSIIQTLDRSINTQLTVMFTLTALALFGGESIRHFVVILLIGIFSGTYSSIFNASPILVVWQNREWRNWFGRKSAA